MTEPVLADTRDMFLVHTMFRREFGAMPDLIKPVADADKERTAIVADHIALIILVLQIHHGAEDKHVWPLLHDRVGAEIEAIIDVMERQHAGIHNGYLRVNEALADWRESASAKARGAVADAVGELLPLLDEHLALEEARVVPLIEKHLTAPEYRKMAEHGQENTPPDILPISLGMLMYEGDPDVIDTIVAELPPEVQPVVRDVATAAYANYARKVYGTPTPDRVRGPASA